jgi:hypothetical protein
MSVFHDQEQMSSGRRPESGAGRVSPPASKPSAGRIVARYVSVTGPVMRGPAGVAVAVASFAVAGEVGGRAGLALASGYMAVIGTYCLLNFLHCRETHCGVTGPGFLLAAAVGFAAALVPGSALSWYRTSTEAAIFLVILAVGYALEWAVACTARRVPR